MQKIPLTQHGKWMPADVQTTISLYMGLVGDQPGILLESAEVDGRLGRYSLIAFDYRLMLHPVDGKLVVEASDERLSPLKEFEGMDFLAGIKEVVKHLSIEQEATGASPAVGRDGLPGLTRGLYGYFGYGVAGMFERKLKDVCRPEDAEACLVLPGQMVLFDHLRHSCCYLSLDEGATPIPAPIQWGADLTAPETGAPEVHPGKEEYMAGVARCKELIAEGECIQVVLSTRFSVPLPDEPFRIYRRLRQANPSPFMFYMKFPDCPSMGKTCGTTLLGSSPEMMVRSARGSLEVRPIAGTRWRGETEKEDIRLEEDLLADPKERAEHVMLVDLGRNDLGRISKPGTVTVEKFMNVERFSHVMHLTSYVEGELKDGLDGVDVLQATFPAGTLSGAPKIRAMEIIAELEPEARGPYGGCIGWIGLDDGEVSLDTGITIRSMWIRDNVCHWQAGAGIVYDSNPEAEWVECNNKARVILEVITGKGGTDVFADR
ncbi:anthranilate synthase component I family protein [Pseudodesulfovibrio thermohalotolerans]|uniref:anthranilate synthase component I family protein n=1 Tax=Pseudodesulfovibrio thermohalotolerans TaxID=2880651 RepID=UPI0024419BAD|nr:anthranilate synthase component I family protein [Pseudodesulfovibrio thermohalotolerans]WFS63486.1 anthranilate synthase component I family protein [Pseudodesulfovibrio thermohalotolerans]